MKKQNTMKKIGLAGILAGSMGLIGCMITPADIERSLATGSFDPAEAERRRAAMREQYPQQGEGWEKLTTEIINLDNGKTEFELIGVKDFYSYIDRVDKFPKKGYKVLNKKGERILEEREVSRSIDSNNKVRYESKLKLNY